VRDVHPTGASFSRTFDGLDRVTRVSRMTTYAPFGTAPSSFDFDGTDKAIGLVAEGIDLAPLVDPTGLLQTLSLGGQIRDYAPDGTLTARGDGQDLAFDARGRLVTATDSAGVASWQYLFDAEGRRMAKIDLGLGQASTRTSYSGN
jgi:YD repeat-containing protein